MEAAMLPIYASWQRWTVSTAILAVIAGVAFAHDAAPENDQQDAKSAKEQKTPGAKSRTFDFTYAATFGQLPKGKIVKIWLPLPQTTADQEVTVEKEMLPGKSSVDVEPQYGNKMLYVEAMPDKDGAVNV